MVGNGGWSYTLNRKDAIANAANALPMLADTKSLLNDTAPQIIYEGRTPCMELAKQYNLQYNDCIKLKWKLTLNRGPITFSPTTYTLNRSQHRASLIEGKWAIIKGYANNPDAVVLQLNPDKSDELVSFLVGDDNVLFFLDKTNQLFIGDNNFSYTLNKRSN